MKQIVSNKLNKSVYYKTAQSKLINLYLDDFERRIIRRQYSRPNEWFYYSSIICYLFLIVKNIFCLFYDLDFETRLILFDVSYFFGGIHVYNEIYMALAFTFSVVLTHKLHGSEDPGLKDFILLLNLIRGKTRYIRLFLTRENVIIINKITRVVNVVYRTQNVMIVSMCEYSLT